MNISYTEETDKEKIQERLGKQIEESEEYAVLSSKTINGVFFYIDSSHSEKAIDAEVNN